MDVHDPLTRSYNMSQIKGKNTKIELIVRKFLHSHGFRYRLHQKDLPGKPDIVLKKLNTVILVHGCYWHGHKKCGTFVVPKSNSEWWLNKITRTITKNKKDKVLLKKSGWSIIELWECELKPKFRIKTLKKLLLTLLKTTS